MIGFSVPKRWSLLSSLIRTITKARTNHVFLLIEDPIFGCELVMEAHETGYRLVPMEVFRRTDQPLCFVVPSVPLDEGIKQSVKRGC